MGPHPLRSWVPPHEFMNFELMGIIQSSGAEETIEKINNGETTPDTPNRAVEMANEFALRKGYTPIFEHKDNSLGIASDAAVAIKNLYNSKTWANRDRSQTRK